MLSAKRIKLFLPFVVLAIAGALFYYLLNSGPERKQVKLKEKVWQVAAVTVKKQTLAPTITLYGKTESPDLLQAAAPASGIVKTITVAVGDRVKPGQLLVSLDQRDFELLLQQAEAELSDIKSQSAELEIRHRINRLSLKTEKTLLNLAEQEVERMRQLKKQNLGSDTDLNQARSALGVRQLSLQSRQLDVDSFPSKRQMLKAQTIRNQARLDEVALMVERSEIRSPFEGIVSSIPVSVGDRVAIGQALIALYPTDTLEIRAHIPATYVRDIQRALDQEQSLSAQLLLDAQSPRVILKRLAGEAQVSGIDVYFDAGASAKDSRPGTLQTLNLSLPPQDDVVAVPFQAIYGNSRIYLFIEGRLQGLDVETIGQWYQPNSDTLLLVKSTHLKNGDQIVVTHLPNAVTGLSVKLTDNHVSAQ